MSVVKDLIAILLVSLIFILGFSTYVCFSYVKPRRYISEATPANFGLVPFEDITFTTDDGIAIRGWYIPATTETDKAIIICHGYPMDKGNVLPFCPMFHDAYNLLLFDFRGMGQSEGGFTTVGLKETKDLEAAIRYLQNRGMQKIGALGFSLGGAVIILANNPHISAAIADSAYAELDMMIASVYGNFGIFKHPFVYTTRRLTQLIFGIKTSRVSPRAAAVDFKAPFLIIHGTEDSQVDVENARLLHEACPHAEQWLVQGADHGQAHYLDSETYEKRVLSFFQTHLGGE
jgi:dipeptidyl aminopeptidase/acylaminoacyl peptidase